jgi:peptidoglycan/xylan/chitin deacetylase (PgdA/CDA1 family)
MKSLIFLSIVLSFSAVGKDHPIEILLTFDDGPSVEKYPFSNSTEPFVLDGDLDLKNPTNNILLTLKKNKIKGAFFVLTGPENLKYKYYKKAETQEGYDLLRKEIAEGHFVNCHWGGNYGSQFRLHTNRVNEPAYDVNRDGQIDKVTDTGNALESDLLQCLSRVNSAYRDEKVDLNPSFMRPPLWKYMDKNGDARPTYKALGLRMLLTDAKLGDGGYMWQGLGLSPPKYAHGELLEQITAALDSGVKDLVLTFHDSNFVTAERFPNLLDILNAHMAKRGLLKGRDWDYTRTTQSVIELMNRKTNFYMYGNPVSLPAQ